MRRKNILVVEDEPVSARLLKRKLERLGYDVPVTAASADEAVRFALDRRPDLVILDIHIQGKRDGIETAKILRGTFDVPIVFLTVDADSDTVDRAKASGPHGYLVKPVTADALRTTVEIALNKYDLERRLQESERRLRGVLDSAGEGIVVADEHGQFIFFNTMAERLLGIGATDSPPSEWAAKYGVFFSDKVTPVPTDELPFVRALRGEASDRVELFIRNARVPDGVFLSFTGRPLRDERGDLRGGIVTFGDVTELKAAHDQLVERAMTDGLTGVPNHRAFKARLSQLLAEGKRGRRFALVMCDVDKFKSLNDTHGHQVGDDALVAVGHALHSNIRETDFLARYGGEEFAVLFADADEGLATTLAEKLRRATAGIERPVPLTASFGVCEYTADFKDDGAALIRAADEALYRAKHAGRNRVVRFHAPIPA